MMDSIYRGSWRQGNKISSRIPVKIDLMDKIERLFIAAKKNCAQSPCGTIPECQLCIDPVGEPCTEYAKWEELRSAYREISYYFGDN